MRARTRTTFTTATALATLAAAGVVVSPRLVVAQAREPYPGYAAYVEQALKTWKVPGTGIAIVRNDSVVFARGFGVRELGRPAPVTERTLFAIGSSSKAFTAAAVAMLVDEKKVSLDAPAATYLPGLQLADPYATRELTVRDLLSHRSGLARGELAWYGSGFDRDEIVRRVRYLQPSWSFRSQFGYQNIMYIAAGQVVAHVANTTWDDFVKSRIFGPLGMTSSSTSTKALDPQMELATPHATVNDTVRPVGAWRNIDNAGPAGSINSHVVDMAQWLRLQLGRGSYGGRQLISARMIEEMHTPHTVIRLDSAARVLNPDTHLQAYGLGWFLQDYRGKLVVQHGGNVDGFTALVAMMPEEKLGVVILTNMNGTGLPTALMNKLFDLHLKAPARDWSGDLYARTLAAQARAKTAQQRLEASRVRDTKPSLPLAAYAGTYADSLYGDIVVREQNGKLSMTFGPIWRGELEHWHFDTFRTKFDTPVLGPIPVLFRLNAAGKVDEMVLDMAGVVTFKRRPDPAPAAANNR
ncbi:serine hydrolase [Roseisolibacter agri]|uniref:Penicillin-binding protein n=1 Tax=Roseisolibacter agri TaxID=2014610 RepID=A0AA37Q1Q7_9BACT|nr:serine hydrolase [Roseisolibacter agri]GLC24949.1 penicillin-binding protein [Roseisolibacter agri]